MNHKKIAAYAAVPVLGLSLLGTQAASAHGFMGGMMNTSPEEFVTHQQTMFQEQADLLGLSVDDVKNAWAEGKTLKQLAEEKGISNQQLQAKMQAAMTQKVKANLQALVDKGIITQAQADKRLAFTQTSMNAMKNSKGMRMGFRHGFGF